jgi:hypothetical protein
LENDWGVRLVNYIERNTLRHALVLTVLFIGINCPARAEAPAIPINVSPAVPAELNPPFQQSGGGAPQATPEQAVAFAWQEFIALNWAATDQKGELNNRDTPSASCAFGDPKCNGPLVWETFRGKVELFPGTGNPPGYPGKQGDTSFGYDALPEYNYQQPVAACDPSQASEPTPFVNLDETSEIFLANMYAGVIANNQSPGNSAPNLIRFLAKANRTQFAYMAGNSDPNDQAQQWWFAIPGDVVTATKAYLAQNLTSPPAGSKTMVSQPFGTIEVKAAFRPLTPTEAASGRFHTQRVRFYEPIGSSNFCYRNATWGLLALHIIQKTPSAPYFIYATFEQADNILTKLGEPVEDVDGNIIGQPPRTANSPLECLVDPQPDAAPPNQTPSNDNSVILTSNTKTCRPAVVEAYCDNPGDQLYYRNIVGSQSVPNDGNICVNRRQNAIPDVVIDANQTAHKAIKAYLQANGIKSTPWLYYKLINVQYFPYDHVLTKLTPNGSLYRGSEPGSADKPSTSTYYQANIVVETNRSLQQFSGGLSSLNPGALVTNWNEDGSQHKNTYYGGHFSSMGGCMGCHGSQGQNPEGQAGDFSVILAIGSVTAPGVP